MGLNAGVIAKQIYGADVKIFDARDCIKENIR